ncbi:MAG: hypothetical protein AAFR16_03450 [Pseudomonadota bacterium]
MTADSPNPTPEDEGPATPAAPQTEAAAPDATAGRDAPSEARADAPDGAEGGAPADVDAAEPQAEAETAPAPKPKRRRRRKSDDAAPAAETAPAAEPPAPNARDGAAEDGGSKPDVAEDVRARTRAAFTHVDAADGARRFAFARWTRPIAPAVYGVAETHAAAMAAGIRRAAGVAGAGAADDDPDYGANLFVFVCEAWVELLDVPRLEELVPDLRRLLAILSATEANQHRLFNFGEDGGIRLAVVLLRQDAEMAKQHRDALALGQAARALLTWSDAAFEDEAPVMRRRDGRFAIRAWHTRLMKVVYDPDNAIPPASDDPELAERLAELSESRRRERRDRRRERKSDDAADAGGDPPEAEAAADADAAPAEGEQASASAPAAGGGEEPADHPPAEASEASSASSDASPDASSAETTRREVQEEIQEEPPEAAADGDDARTGAGADA